MSKLKKYRFSDLYTMSSGISSSKEQAGHGSPFLSFSTVFNNYFIPETLVDLMSTSEKEKKTYSIKNGDIFLTRTSELVDELAMSSVAIRDYPEASYSGFLKRLRPTQTNISYSKFMAFYLRSPMFRKTMTNNAVMTLRASLNEAIFSYLELLLPEFNEQVKAGDLLFLLNKKIEINNRINTELEGMAKTLYDYWFVQFDFPDVNGKPYKSSGGKMIYNEALKREIPEGWDNVLLSEIGSFKNGINYDPKEKGNSIAKIVNVRDISNSSIFLRNDTLDELALEQQDIDKYLIQNDSILIARSGTPGSVRMLVPEDKNTIYCGFIISFNLYDASKKLVTFFFLKNLEKAILSQSSGSILKNVSQESLKAVNLPLPPNNILFNFNKILSPIMQQLNVNLCEISKLESLRDWLLPMLMNGQVTVTTEAKPENHPQNQAENSAVS